MKIGLISDLHATLCALDAVLAALDDEGVQTILCLGDIIDMGPSPNAVVARLRERAIPCVVGNHDPLDEHPVFPLLAAVEGWTRDTLHDNHRDWLATLPRERIAELDGARLLCVHGSPRALDEGLTDAVSAATLHAWLAGYDVDGLVAGHTHVQLVRRDGPHTFVNVGTTSQPFARPYDGKPPQVLPFCDYAIIDASADTIDHGQGARRVARIDVSLRRLSFPFSAFAAELRATSFPHQDAWLAQWARSSSPG